MDVGDWIFYGLIFASVVGSVVKSVKKKQAEAAVHEDEPTEPPSSDGSDWIKNVMRETTKSLFDVDDDDFIPRNPKPAPATTRQPATMATPVRGSTASTRSSVASERTPLERPSRPAEDYRRPTQSAEDYRRRTQSAEVFHRPDINAERFAREAINLEQRQITRNIKLKQAASNVEDSSINAQPPLLVVSDDLWGAQEAMKALIYGEIMRPKF